MKEIVVISGKGGTGKTSIAAAFAWLAKKDVVIADCDVDASDLHLLLHPDNTLSEDFYSGKTAFIEEKNCIQCGLCKDVCRFNAISETEGKYKINEIDCEGCGYCFQVCPENAIILNQNKTGKLYIGHTRMNNKLVHARLNIGADNSGKLVSKIRKETKLEAKKNKTKFILVDGSPGIGCPVIASITGADYIVLVTEPTISGFHDLKRVYELTEQFRLVVGCIINKADLNYEINTKIKSYLDFKKIDLLAELPYDTTFSEAITNGKTIIEYENGEISKRLKSSWKKITKINNMNNRANYGRCGV